MKDIVITMSTKKKHAPSIEDEKQWMDDTGGLCYPLSKGKPQHCVAGCWVYIIRGGKLGARGIAKDFHPPTSEKVVFFSGEETVSSSWKIFIHKIDIATSPIKVRGFQGFRYLRESDKSRFEDAFV